MHMFQRTKASMTFLRKTRVAKLFLVFACLLLCLMVLSLFPGAGTAHAASLGAKSANTLATSGGGCSTDLTGKIRPCLSEDSTRSVAPDGYILQSYVCGVVINLYADGYDDGAPITSINFGSQCFSAGTHLYGAKYPDASAYHTWHTGMYYNEDYGTNWASPPLHT